MEQIVIAAYRPKPGADDELLAMWERYAKVCDYVKLPQLIESEQLFAGFASVDEIKETI